ncbi:MAG: carbohydrate ABC transporter substrate-binding protein [Clostridia bacterium]|nr:carbohydrate ABC transporter substrate-binding protein [Clostridia bacterium]
MKRIISLILALMLMLGAVSAFAAPGDATIYNDENNDYDFYVSSFAWYDGVMYMVDWGQNIYTWTSESGEIKTWPIPEDVTGLDLTENSASLNRIIPGDDGVYLLYQVEEISEEGGYNFEHMLLIKPTVNGEELIFDTEPVELDWDDLVEEYDDYSYANSLNSAFIKDGMLMGTSWAGSGENVIAVIDIEDDDMELYSAENANFLCPYKEGKALTVLRTYENEDDPAVIAAIDLESGEMEELMQVQTTGWSYPSQLAYDEANDYFFYALNGELHRVKGMDAATTEAVAALNVDTWSNNLAYATDDGFYICGDYDTIIMRNTDPSLRAEQSITVYTSYNPFMEKALYDFNAVEPDVEVVIANNYEDLTQAMMNQSSSIDIYTVYVNNQDFAAVFDRGYMTELDSSAAITDFVNSVYPAMQEVLKKDGHVVAVPVEMWANCWSYNPVAFEKLGLTEDDVPKSWPEFMQFAKELPAMLGENEEGFSLFDPYYTAEDARHSLFYQIIEAYMVYLQQDGVDFAFDTELMRGLIKDLDEIDFAALGFMESYEEEMDYMYKPETILFQTYSNIGGNVWAMNDEYARPMPMAMTEGGKPTIAGNMTVAFVNPYSENRELAVKYLESAVNCIDHSARVNMCPDFNETLENAYYEENIASYEETIASWQEELEKTEDEETRAMIEQNIADFEKYKEEYIAENRYDISEESIAFYRKYAEFIEPTQFIGFDEEASTEFYTQLSQYMEGAIDADTFLKNIDKKLRMMMLEDQ